MWATLVVLVAALALSATVQAQTYTRTETITYYDNTSKWVLGQVAKRVVEGITVEETTYSTNAQPLTIRAFGKLQQTLTYNADGTVATVRDGNNNVTTLSSWKRGIPQTIKYPATPESPSGATQSAVVNDSGWITRITDENGYATNYTYDAMGRVASVVYPTGDSTAWNTTTQVFEPVAAAEYGIPAGHWRQTVSTGNARKITYFDALWRPRVTREYDTANEAGTKRFQRFTYDHEGRVTFASYSGTSDALSTGIWTEYDALGRTTSVSQDSELGPLTTLTTYASDATGPYTRVTDPRGVRTVTRYQMFDQPTYDFPVLIDQAQNLPERVGIDITRDVFGKPLSIRKRNSANTVSLTRSYTYNANQELCRTVEPETDATLMGYDGAGNLTWSAAGLPVGTACHTTGLVSPIQARRVARTYDARNRVKTLSFPDGLGDTMYTYTPDGLPASIMAVNGGGNTVTSTYAYNRRRMLVHENMQRNSTAPWNIDYAYDAMGNLASTKYPSGVVVNYVPNALGQPTQAGTYATGVSYYPNGAMKQFTYGNGIVHNLVQNARQLPERSYDCAAAGTGCVSANKRLDLSYAYDVVGNVSGVTDNRNGRQTRSMSYDGLDRLTQTVSPMFGTASYGYNVLDNLTTVKVTGGSNARDHTYTYDTNNRLSNIKHTVGGATVVGLGYDAQGNLANKNGQTYSFDYGNRLRLVSGKESYLYDGHGRRVYGLAAGGTSIVSHYSQSGQLLYQQDYRQAKRFEHVYLGGSLVATRETPHGTTTTSVKYQHTDALGTPTAVTDANKALVETSEYEPYGQLVNRALTDGPGFTGHVQDAATGLTYMQQRYYDPQSGVFLSVDPVTAYGNPARQFHRYRYAENNPYKFYDPDGRVTEVIAGRGVTDKEANDYIRRVMWSPIARGEWEQIDESSRLYTAIVDSEVDPWYDGNNHIIYLNPHKGLRIASVTRGKGRRSIQSPEVNGGHEISHAAEHDRIGDEAYARALQKQGNKPSREEVRAQKVEKEIGKDLNEPTRKNYEDHKGFEDCRNSTRC
ncbi:RHS repeat-associated core domain-containing protein [Pseudoxanthomonas putridarboris]|uniref:RHS repeat-associated core domain-containing protein n=1 Tax=Pseudoxanthomonas putridarboris TaxID=752605 RepID=A0ABU9J3D2_9GAMM